MNINLLAPINQLGYGVASLNILDRLMEMGHEVALFPIGHTDVPDDKRPLVTSTTALAGFFDEQAPSLRIWHQHALAEHVGRGVRIGFPFFELDRLKANEVHHLRSLDRAVVASRWAAGICERHNITATVAPLGVDRAVFHESVPAERWSPDHTVFVNVGKWEIRKGHDILISAFNKAFEPRDKVILRLVPTNPFIGSGNLRWAQMCSGSKMGRSIEIRERFQSQRGVALFLRSADCAVFPSRGEAWNLELLEALSCGIQCIATNYSGHTEYINQENSRIIDVSETEDAIDGVWFHGEGQWARLGPEQEEQLIEHMRAVHRLKQTGQLTANAAGIETAKKFSWRRTAKSIEDILQ